MIETMLTQTYCVFCDRCGEKALGPRPARRQEGPEEPAVWYGTVELARKTALEIGFHLSQWQEGGCPRELWLCEPCWLKALNDLVVAYAWLLKVGSWSHVETAPDENAPARSSMAEQGTHNSSVAGSTPAGPIAGQTGTPAGESGVCDRCALQSGHLVDVPCTEWRTGGRFCKPCAEEARAFDRS